MTKIFVGNLPFEVTSADLLAAFSAYGPVSGANVVMDRLTGNSRGFGFIEMASPSQATAAIAALDGTTLKGRSINVSLTRARANPATRGASAPGWAVVGAARHRW